MTAGTVLPTVTCTALGQVASTRSLGRPEVRLRAAGGAACLPSAGVHAARLTGPDEVPRPGTVRPGAVAGDLVAVLLTDWQPPAGTPVAVTVGPWLRGVTAFGSATEVVRALDADAAAVREWSGSTDGPLGG